VKNGAYRIPQMRRAARSGDATRSGRHFATAVWLAFFAGDTGAILARRSPKKILVDARLEDLNAFRFEELSLKRSVGFADEKLAVLADDAVPGDSFSGRAGGHGAARGARAARETQGFRERPIG
jgi:hypothetical protein